MSPKEYAKKRNVSQQAVQRAIAKAQAHSLPCPLLPGVTAVTKNGRRYELTIAGTIKKGRPGTYFK